MKEKPYQEVLMVSKTHDYCFIFFILKNLFKIMDTYRVSDLHPRSIWRNVGARHGQCLCSWTS